MRYKFLRRIEKISDASYFSCDYLSVICPYSYITDLPNKGKLRDNESGNSLNPPRSCLMHLRITVCRRPFLISNANYLKFVRERPGTRR